MSYDIKIDSDEYAGHLKNLAEAEGVLARRRDEMEQHRLMLADGICRVVFVTKDGLEAYDHVTKMAREPGPVPLYYYRPIRAQVDETGPIRRTYRFTHRWVYGSPVYEEVNNDSRKP